MDAGLPLGTIAVNISAMEFRDEDFLEGVFAVLNETGLDPRFLELELTESVLMKRAESAESILKTLRARGVQVAVDDFGTGYSSLSYLRKFPIDALKIDQSFVRQITTAPAETAIVTAVISMGRSLICGSWQKVWKRKKRWLFFWLTNATRRRDTTSSVQYLPRSTPRCSRRGCRKQSFAESSLTFLRLWSRRRSGNSHRAHPRPFRLDTVSVSPSSHGLLDTCGQTPFEPAWEWCRVGLPSTNLCAATGCPLSAFRVVSGAAIPFPSWCEMKTKSSLNRKAQLAFGCLDA